MRLIDAEGSELQTQLKIIREAEYQIYGSGSWGFTAKCEHAIEDAPTVFTEPHWIPVAERLPENNDPVNVTWVNRNPEVYYMDIKDKPFTATAHYHKGYWYWYSSVTQDYLNEYGEWTPDLVDKDVEIIAWMPLPEPYKGVTE